MRLRRINFRIDGKLRKLPVQRARQVVGSPFIFATTDWVREDTQDTVRKPTTQGLHNNKEDFVDRRRMYMHAHSCPWYTSTSLISALGGALAVSAAHASASITCSASSARDKSGVAARLVRITSSAAVKWCAHERRTRAAFAGWATRAAARRRALAIAPRSYGFAVACGAVADLHHTKMDGAS